MPVKIFFCYAHEDESQLNILKKYLMPMQRQGLIDVWYDRDISAGIEWEQEISKQLNIAQIILLLISPDFMASDYCYGIEMKRALQRHHQKEARVIPVILRSIDWQDALGNIQALPTDAKAILSSYWHSPDEAFFDVAEGIRKTVTELLSRSPSIAPQEFNKEEEHSNTSSSAKIIPTNISYKVKVNQKDCEYEIYFSLSQQHLLRFVFLWGVVFDTFIIYLDNTQIAKKKYIASEITYSFVVEDRNCSLHFEFSLVTGYKILIEIEGETILEKSHE